MTQFMTRRMFMWFAKAFGTALAVFVFASVQAEEMPEGEYTPDGQTICQDCHDNDSINGVFHSAHAQVGDERTPFANRACESCHGPSKEHTRRARRVPPGVSFGPKKPSEPEVQNAACLSCHKGGEQIHWDSSAHGANDLTCADCHQSHAAKDPVLDRRSEVDVCVTCHQQQNAQLHMPSRHPIKETKTLCSDCHNPHGSIADSLLVRNTVNETCYECHEDKRGPFLFEHQPASEDCSLCHNPHGAVNDNLLEKRGPFLCQQCHMANFHPSDLYGAGGLPSGAPNQNMLGKNCMNCHSQVHGTNHPSGPRLTR